MASTAAAQSARATARPVAATRPGARRARWSGSVASRASARCADSKDHVAIVTGANCGLGLQTTKSLVKDFGWHVVMAVRNPKKAKAAIILEEIPEESVTIMECDLNSLKSVRDFVTAFKADAPLSAGLEALCCNAAVYFPNQTKPTFSEDGYEECVQVNHLGHFLMANMLLPDLATGAKENGHAGAKRCVIVGSVTGNTNTVAGQVPPRADLGDLQGFRDGFKGGDMNAGTMIDGGRYVGPKAYKDAKLCNMLTATEMHRRYHDKTGVVFSTMYPGCIADSDLFRNHTPFFQWFFPILQKYVTKGYVSQAEAGKRLAKVVADPAFSESGNYWAWKEGGDQLWDNYNSGDRDTAFANKLSKEASDQDKAAEMFDLSAKLVDVEPLAV